eukprot:363488-Chlamydomonas_euryale.AAC.5
MAGMRAHKQRTYLPTPPMPDKTKERASAWRASGHTTARGLRFTCFAIDLRPPARTPYGGSHRMAWNACM